MASRSRVTVGIGLAVFVVGGGMVAIVLRSHVSSSRPAAPPSFVAARSVVVAKQAIKGGTSGDALVQQGLVEQRPIGTGDTPAGDAVTSVVELTGQTVTTNVAAGGDIRRPDLRPIARTATTARSVAIPDGMQGLTVSLPSPQGAGGYVQPGDTVNVYANISKAADEKLQKLGATSPCTTLVAPNVMVVDVNPRPGPQPVAQPGAVTYLLAVDPPTARIIIFFEANEALYLTLVPHGQRSSGTLPCASYAQEVPHP